MPSSANAPRHHKKEGRAAAATNDGNTGAAKATISGGGGPPMVMRRRENFGIRQRADSNDSTRGAFYQGPTTPRNAAHAAPKVVDVVTTTVDNTGPRRRGKKEGKPKASGPAPAPEKTSVADLASLAMMSLDPGDISPLPSSQPFARTHELSLDEDDDAAPRHQRKPSKGAAARRALMTRVERVPEAQSQSSRLDPINEKKNASNAAATAAAREESREPSFFFSQLVSPNSGDSGDSLQFSGALYAAAEKKPRPPMVRDGSNSLYGDALDLDMDNIPATRHVKQQPSQQDEINYFSSLVHATEDDAVAAAMMPPTNYGSTAQKQPATNNGSKYVLAAADTKSYDDDDDSHHHDDDSYAGLGIASFFIHQVMTMLDPTDWLTKDAHMENDEPVFEGGRYTLAGLVRHFLFNPLSPEFTSLQQFSWACLLGVAMGLYTAVWKWFIEAGVDFIWETVPERLLEWGAFTDAEGAFPLYHYMWMVPAVFGGVLSYIFVALPTKIPDQNTWIDSVHKRGVQDHRTFFQLFFLSTAGMWSGLSLGPELPLVLTAGMVGSWLALLTKQSMLQARVLNMTAASAAVGGFFGFPMAGALFVLEIPHRMGLQYFEALSPGTIASIIAVLTNRMVIGNDVTGYFKYPFLSTTLPSSIFTSAVVYGFYGCVVGILYTYGAILFKTWVHDWFHAPHDDHHHHGPVHSNPAEHADDSFEIDNGSAEVSPLMAKKKRTLRPKPSLWGCIRSYFCFVIPEEKYRAATAGVIAGALVGAVGIFVPHTMFWGEAQLQNLIDKGRTPLPIFGGDGEATSALIARAVCMIDPTDAAAIRAGFGVGCSALIAVTKTIGIGLSLGTGIIGGHFWGPLYVGCAASHLFTDLVKIFDSYFGFGGGLSAYPCVVILCTMGAAHVVTFRAHMAIMLILTLTISAFDVEDSNSPFDVAGDYSAVFPLLVVSVFISLMASRDTVFYNTQRSRGDITAVPEVLCQPGMEGAPLIVAHQQDSDEFSYGSGSFTTESGSDIELAISQRNSAEESLTQQEIEKAFAKAASTNLSPLQEKKPPVSNGVDAFAARATSDEYGGGVQLTSARLDELLHEPIPKKPEKRKHRRTQSAPMWPQAQPIPAPKTHRSRQNSKDWGAVDTAAPPTPESRSRTNSVGSQKDLIHVASFGEILDHQPSLMEQARMRAASSVIDSAPPTQRHRRVPSMPSNASAGGGRHKRVPSLPMGRSRQHSRNNSQSSQSGLGGALTPTDIEQSLIAGVNGNLMANKSLWSNQS